MSAIFSTKNKPTTTKRKVSSQNHGNYQTISSIPKDCKEYKLLQSYIDIEELLFSLNSIDEIENLYKNIISIINQNKENENLFLYLIELLIFYILIRPKQKEIPCLLLIFLLSDFKDKQKFIIETIKDNQYYKQNVAIRSVLHVQGIVIKEKPKQKEFTKNINNGLSANIRISIYEEERKEKLKQQEILEKEVEKLGFSIYEKGTLEYILKEDDLNELKEYLNSHENILKDDFKFILNPKTIIPLSFVIYHIETIDLLDFCSFYGSIQCFKFLKANGFKYGDFIKEMSIAGGNFDIIHQVENDGILFDNCFDISLKFHHNNINDWLQSNYKSYLDLYQCLLYYNYKGFVFLLLNGSDVDNGSISPLCYLIEQSKVNIELIKYLIENGADTNIEYEEKKLYSRKQKYSPLINACINKEINIEVIKLLLDNGADITKEINKKSALCFLCENENATMESIDL